MVLGWGRAQSQLCLTATSVFAALLWISTISQTVAAEAAAEAVAAAPSAKTTGYTRMAVIGDHGSHTVGAGRREKEVASLVAALHAAAPLDGIINLGDCNYP